MMSYVERRLPSQVKLIKEKLAASPLVYRLARGAFWSLLGGVASRIFTVIASIIVARIVGKVGFGEFGMVQSTMGMFGVLAGFGLGSTATKYVAEYRRSNPARAGKVSNLILLVSLASSGILAAVCVLMSPWLAAESLHRSDIIYILQAGSLLLLFSTMNSVMLGILAGFEAFQSAAKINIWQGIAAPLVAIPLVWNFGVAGAIASLTVNAALGMILCSYALRSLYRDYSITAAYSNSLWSEWPILWKFALPAMLSGLVVAPVTWLTNLILVNRVGGYGELGLFNAANQWRTIILFLPGLLASVMLPVLSDVHGQENRSDFTQAIILNLRATWVVSLPLTIMLIVLNKPLAAIFGRAFSGSAPVMALLMVSCFLMVVNGTVGTALVSSGRIWTGTALNIGWAAALVAGAYLMVPSMGAQGLAAAYLLAYLLHTIWTMLYVEIKLAPSSVSLQWKLILFSVMLLAAGLRSAFMATDTYIGSVTLLLLSLLPAGWVTLRGMRPNPDIGITGNIL